MSKIFQTHSRKIIAGGVLAGAIALVQTGSLPNPFYTTGVQNIEKRYSSGGAAPNKTPAAATKIGNSDQVEANTETRKGIATPMHKEKFEEQKPEVSDKNLSFVGIIADIYNGHDIAYLVRLAGGPSGFDKTWNQAHYHEDKGK